MPTAPSNPSSRQVPLICLVIALLLGLPLAAWLDLHHISDTMLRRQAADVDSLLTNVRIYYTENVARRVLTHPKSTNRVVHNYLEIPGAIPVPATVSLDLAPGI